MKELLWHIRRDGKSEEDRYRKNFKKKKKYESPDSPRSVGWTRPYTVRLADKDNPFSWIVERNWHL